MKFSAIAFAAGAAVASVEAQGTTANFEITNFVASCVAHSTQCNVSFDVLEPGTMQTTPQHCAIQVTQGAIHELPPIENGTCEQTSKTWTLTKSADAFTLTVSVQVSPISFKTGSRQFGPGQFQVIVPVDDPTGAYQAYLGPSTFSLYPANS